MLWKKKDALLTKVTLLMHRAASPNENVKEIVLLEDVPKGSHRYAAGEETRELGKKVIKLQLRGYILSLYPFLF
jgi:hypothetical protein